MITTIFAGIGRRIAFWGALAIAITVALWVLIRQGRLQAEAELATRQAEARIRAMQSARETRHEVRNADRAELERRADRWMRD